LSNEGCEIGDRFAFGKHLTTVFFALAGDVVVEWFVVEWSIDGSEREGFWGD